MSISQLYETTVIDSDLRLSARFVILPTRFFQVPLESELLTAHLGLEKVTQIEPGYLTLATAVALASDSPKFLDFWPFESAEHVQVANRHYRFAEYLTMARVIPFESSPLSSESVGSLVAQTTGSGLGALVAFAVVGTSPILFIVVPAGMILFGGAAGVARGLESGLRKRVESLIAPVSDEAEGPDGVEL